MAQATTAHQKISLSRVLGPAHVWALGVGIVLVGEYTGWRSEERRVGKECA